MNSKRIYIKITTMEQESIVISRLYIYNSTVKYNLNEWVKPLYECGPLCVFDSIKNARDFIREYPGSVGRMFQVFECEIIPSAFSAVWNSYGKSMRLIGLPRGTVLADAVKLTKRIKINALA